MTKKIHSVLLPKHISPDHYDIFLKPDLENFIFEGSEEIQLSILKSVTSIVLHCSEIEIKDAKISIGKKDEIAQKISYNEKDETATLLFNKQISKGKVILKLTFTGVLNNKMRGFYRSKYTLNGKNYFMAVTQFESTDARRAFPCFDEPSLKSTFNVTLKVPSDRTVISNTLEEEIIDIDKGLKIVRFAKSPKMSTYLLAFIVGHFEHVQTITKEGVKVRVYVTPGKNKQALFALETASKIMSYYHHYFGIAYPLPTMDLIAIPDFANGAMENWGAVTYRESALLVDDKISSQNTKQWVALIIAHELAHQWFGNLVTMKWWTDLWLNEGFASFMEYAAVDKLFPEWNIWTQFAFTEQARALTLDGLFNTHAIEIKVNHPGEISEIFDAVSYSKGASIIRMLEAYLGEKIFQKGLQLYIKENMYSNAETKDLWKALEKVSKKPVESLMQNWTSKPGYPLVTISKSGGDLIISQERFLANEEHTTKKGELWKIPLDFVTDNTAPTTPIIISKKTVKLSNFKKHVWLKANVNDTSFVRVQYSNENLEALKIPIKNKDKKITEEGRFAIVRDAFALVESGHLSTDEVLNLLSSYVDDKSYIVWAETTVQLLNLKALLYGSSIYDNYCKFAIDLLQNIFDFCGWEKAKDESHETTLLRSAVVYSIGTFGDQKNIKIAQHEFEKVTNGKNIDSDMRALIYALTAENGKGKEFERFVSIYTSSDLEEEKDRALRALCSFKNEALLTKVLTIVFSTNVRAQDALKAIYMLSANPIGINLAWDYVKENWTEITDRYAGGHLFARFITPFSKFKSTKMANEIESFFEKNKSEGIDRTVAQTIEKIRSNDALLKRELPHLEKFLTK